MFLSQHFAPTPRVNTIPQCSTLISITTLHLSGQAREVSNNEFLSDICEHRTQKYFHTILGIKVLKNPTCKNRFVEQNSLK